MNTSDTIAIEAMLGQLTAEQIKEVHDFISFLIEKERRCNAFADRIDSARTEPSIEFASVTDLMAAIRQPLGQ